MKRIITVLLIIVVGLLECGIGFAQEKDKKEPVTKLETFLTKKGKLVVKDCYEIGKINGSYGAVVVFTSMVISEPGLENERVRGLKIEITEGGRYEKSNSSFLDPEEIESLSKAIEYMLGLSTKWKDTNKEYTETIFSTKDDFQIGFWQKGNEQRAFSSSGYIGKASCFFATMQDLSSAKTIVEKGLTLLKEK